MAQQASAVVDPGPSGPNSPGVAQRRLILPPGPAPLGHSRHIPHSCPASTRLWPVRYGAAVIRKQTDGARAGTGVLTGRGRRELIIGRLSPWYLSAPAALTGAVRTSHGPQHALRSLSGQTPAAGLPRYVLPSAGLGGRVPESAASEFRSCVKVQEVAFLGFSVLTPRLALRFPWT